MLSKNYLLTALIALCLTFNLTSYATHLNGGYIDYAITNGTNGSKILNFQIVLLHEPFGAGANQSITVEYKTLCDGIIRNTTAQRGIHSNLFPPSQICKSGITSVPFSLHVYNGAFNFPANTCMEGTLQVAPLCCRSSPVNNVNFSGNLDNLFYLFTDLTNLAFQTNNTSPQIGSNNLLFNSCKNNSTTFGFPINDVDDDSLYFDNVAILSGSNSTVPYNANYNVATVLLSNTPNVYDHTTGFLHATPNTDQVVVQGNQLFEYKHNPQTGIKELVSMSYFERFINIQNTCNPAIQQLGIDVDSSLTNNLYANLNCNQTSLEIDLNVPVLANSITKFGSEFVILNSNNYLLPVIKAYAADSLFYTEKIKLEFGAPVDYNDTLRLFLKTGTDFNTLLNLCGGELKQDTLMLAVSNCTGLSSNVSATKLGYEIYPNPISDVFTIISPFNSVATIYDLTGKLKKSITLNSGENLIEVQLNAGVYLIELRANGTSEFRKIVIKP